HQPDLLAQRLHRNAFAGKHRAYAELALELDILRAQPPRLHRVLDHNERAVQREWLLQKVVSAQLGGLHRGLDGAVAADDHYLRPHLHGQLVHIGQHVEPVAVGKPYIQQNHIIGRVIQQHQGLGSGSRRSHSVALLAQDLFERSANLRLVVHHQNVIHARIPFSGAAALPGASALPGSAVSLSGVAGASCSSSTVSINGNRSRKRAPLGLLASARRLPPCSCTILAAIDSPSPVPRCLVEWYGRNSRSRISSVNPWPVSETTISTDPPS